MPRGRTRLRDGEIEIVIPPPGPEREMLCAKISDKMCERMQLTNGAPEFMVRLGLEAALDLLCPRKKQRRVRGRG